MEPTDSVRQEKKLIRVRVLKRLAAMEPSEVESASQEILVKLMESSWWDDAAVVLTYLSMNKEVTTDGIVQAAHQQMKEVAVPCIDRKNMFFYPLNPSGQEYSLNWYGIREPDSNGNPVQFTELAERRILLVVPGLAFDRNRNRLGRGGGYYDRFIDILRDTPGVSLTVMGIFFQNQFEPDLPLHPWDQPLDVVITEQEIIC
jgi:5-formyltetrahydrofolate cyclo-ligase